MKLPPGHLRSVCATVPVPVLVTGYQHDLLDNSSSYTDNTISHEKQSLSVAAAGALDHVLACNGPGTGSTVTGMMMISLQDMMHMCGQHVSKISQTGACMQHESVTRGDLGVICPNTTMAAAVAYILHDHPSV